MCMDTPQKGRVGYPRQVEEGFRRRVCVWGLVQRTGVWRNIWGAEFCGGPEGRRLGRVRPYGWEGRSGRTGTDEPGITDGVGKGTDGTVNGGGLLAWTLGMVKATFLLATHGPATVTLMLLLTPLLRLLLSTSCRGGWVGAYSGRVRTGNRAPGGRCPARSRPPVEGPTPVLGGRSG